MLGLLSDIKHFFGLIFQLGDWLLLGAALAFAGAMFHRWVGYAGVAVGGSIIMFLAITGSWLGDDSDKVKRLEAELEAKKAELAITQATNSQLTDDLEAEAEAAEINAGIAANLKQIIDTLPDNPECGVGEEFTDELNKLQ